MLFLFCFVREGVKGADLMCAGDDILGCDTGNDRGADKGSQWPIRHG